MPESYTGDEGTVAFNAGLDVMDGTEDRRQGFLAINKTRDMLVQFATDLFNSISLSWGSITGKPATFPPSAHQHPITQITTADGSQNYGVALQATLDGKYPVTGGEITGNVVLSSGNVYVPAATVVSSGWTTAAINGDGRIGRTPSARKYKKDIRDHVYTITDALAVRIRNYRLKSAIYGSPDAPVEVGVIAEELIEAGLSEFVFFGQDGEPEGVHYERLALIALGALQDIARDQDALEQRVTALENR